jgi:hypothetical protein
MISCWRHTVRHAHVLGLVSLHNLHCETSGLLFFCRRDLGQVLAHSSIIAIVKLKIEEIMLR